MRLIVLSSVLSTLLLPSCAFVTAPWQLRTREATRSSAMKLYGMLPRDHDTPEDDEAIELKRQRLEQMMTDNEDTMTPVMERKSLSMLHLASLPEVPPLTAIGKERRIAEIRLLGQLEENDESMEELYSLWFSERGPKAAMELRAIEELTGQGPRAWPEAEDRLHALIKEHGLYFVEAVYRLSTLYFLWGRLEESKALCELVIQAKPWHVGALSGIVMVCAGMSDAQSARAWAARRLPPIQPTGPNKRRKEWVERALHQSTRSLLEAEKRVKKAFGVPDRRYKINTFDDHNSWQ